VIWQEVRRVGEEEKGERRREQGEGRRKKEGRSRAEWVN
jgi:hypothetical protein